MESKYNLLTRLLKNIKNVVNPDGGVAGVVPVVHTVTEETVALTGTLPDVAGYQWIPRQTRQTGETPMGPFIQIDFDDAPDIIPAGVFIKPTDSNNWIFISNVIAGSGFIKIDVSYFGLDGGSPSEDYFNGALIKVVSETSTRLDKTYKELVDSGFFVAHVTDERYPNEVSLLIPRQFGSDDSGYYIGLLDLMGGSTIVFVASQEDEDPVLVVDDSGTLDPGNSTIHNR